MDADQIAALFELLVGDDTAATAYKAILTMAQQEVEQEVLPETDLSDARLCYLAAAVAFLRYIQIVAARDRAACTFAGTIAQNTDAEQKYRFAVSLVKAYQALCHSLLVDEEFWFQSC